MDRPGKCVLHMSEDPNVLLELLSTKEVRGGSRCDSKAGQAEALSLGLAGQPAEYNW